MNDQPVAPEGPSPARAPGAPRRRRRRGHRPNGNDPRQNGNEARPGGTDLRQNGNDPRPGGNRPPPGGFDARPGGDRPRAARDDRRPGGGQSRRRGKHRRPGGDQRRPDGERRPDDRRGDARPPGPALPPRATLDAAKPSTAPLSAPEKAALKQHFAFIAKYRKDLRLRANDAEDLLINGAREPEDRGVCMHLLGKVDRALVNATLARVADPGRRTRILAGVVRFSRDVAILIQYLECLTASASRDEAAATLAVALSEIDYASVSPAQMRRVLELMAAVLPEAERPMAVLGLLRSASFRDAYDHASEALPEALASLFAPMRAVFAELSESRQGAPGTGEPLATGLRILLSGSAASLDGLPEEARARLVAAALELGGRDEALERAIDALLGGLSKDGRRYSQLALERARQLMAASRDAEARLLLAEIAQHQPDFKLPGRWLLALDAPRVGNLALLEAAKGPPAGVLQRGLWLERQQPVWALVGSPEEGRAFADAAELHGSMALPGLVPLLTSGVGSDGRPFLAVAPQGEPFGRCIPSLRSELGRLPALMRSGVELVAALALAGVTLPDADLRRFTLDRESRLAVASLVGCRVVAPAASGPEALASARALCEALASAVGGGAARRLLRRVGEVASVQALARGLALL